MKTSLFIAMIVSVGFVSGCGTEDSGDTETDGAETTGAATTGAATTGTPTTGADTDGASGLDGAWETACTLLPQQMLYAKTRLEYSGPNLTGTYRDYSDAGCTMGMGVSTWTGTATVGGAAAVAGATKLDLAFESYTYEPLNDQAASINNMYMYCGFSDWAANVEKDVLDQPCFGFAIPTGGKSLDIYLIEGTTLKFGKGSQISVTPAEADRPVEIDDTRVFTKVG